MKKIRHIDRLPENDAAGNPVAHPPVINWANQVADKIDEIVDRVNSLSDTAEESERIAKDVRSLKSRHMKLA